MTKTIIRIWMLIALLLVATTGYAQKTIIQKSNKDYSLTSKLSFSGSSFVDTQGADKDGYNEASYRVFEGVLSPNEPLKIQCSASCLNGKKKAAYKIRILIWFTKENGSVVKSPVNGGGEKTSQDKPLSVSCKIPKEATYANATIEVKGTNGTQADPSTICHLSYKIQGRDGSQSKNSGNSNKNGNTTNKQTSQTKKKDCGCDKEPAGDRVDSKIRFNDIYGEVSIRPYWKGDYAYESADFETVIFECDLIKTEEDSGCILGLEDMNAYCVGPETKLLIKTEDPKVSKLELIVGTIWGNIKKMAEGKSIELEMSHCITGIKGTIVAFEETGKESRVYLFAGKVEVTGKASKKKTMLKAGQASIVGSDGKIKVKKFDIEKGAKKFGIPMKDIKNHYSNTPTTSSSKGSSTKVSSSGTISEKVQKRYAMQRGVIKYKYAKGKQTGAIVRSFDSYGHYERVASKIKGSSATSLNIYRGEKAYKVDTKAKTVTQSKHEAINFLNITEAELSKHKLKKKGTATVAGKQCVVYGNANEDYYVWQGITLKKVVNSKDGKIVSEAVSITQPAKIDANKFKVPSNYTMK